MHARVITVTVQPETMSAAIDICCDAIAPATQAQPGFQGMIALSDESTGKLIVTMMWGSEEEMLIAEADSYYREQLGKLMGVIAAPPRSEQYAAELTAFTGQGGNDMLKRGTERNPNVARETIRAAEGEPVSLWLNRVAADKWEQHHHFVHEILMPGVEKVDPAAYRHTRFLHPAEPNEDGTYTSAYLMDPIVEDAEYEIQRLLKKAYGEEKGEEYYQLWVESLEIPQIAYKFIQSEGST